MSPKITGIIGWTLSILLALLLIMSAYSKITLNEMGLEQAKALGVDPAMFQMMGVVEIIALLLFLMPRTGVVGALLLIAYMGGAIAAHVILHRPVGMVVVLEAFIWIAAAFRFPELRTRLFGSSWQ